MFKEIWTEPDINMQQELFLILLIIAPTVYISYSAFKNRELFDKLKFNASHISTSKEWYRFFTYGFVHADMMHLVINMFVLWSFGSYILPAFEIFHGNFGNLYFLGLYFPAIAFSSFSSFLRHRNNVYYNAVGASGAVSAVVFAFIILSPGSKMGLLLIPIGLPSWLFGLLYLVYSVYMDKKQMDNVGHDAHFWGGIYGIIYALLTIPNAFNNFIEYFI